MNATMLMLWLCCGNCGVETDLFDFQPTFSLSTITIYYITGSLCIFFGIITITVNTVFLISMKLEPSLHTSAMKILMVLASVDIFQGFTSWPMYGIYLMKMTRGDLDCMLNKVMLVFGFGLGFANVSSIFVIVLSQYLSIIYPMQFRAGVSIMMLIAPLFIINAVSILSGIISLFVYDYFQYQKLALGVITVGLLLLMCFFYVHITITVGQSRQRVVAEHTSNNIKRNLVARKQSIKLAKTALVILCSFLLCYAPLIILVVIVGVPSTFPTLYAEIFSNIIALCNSFMDYFVYHWRIKGVRQAVKKSLGKLLKKCSFHQRNDFQQSSTAQQATSSQVFQITT